MFFLAKKKQGPLHRCTWTTKTPTCASGASGVQNCRVITAYGGIHCVSPWGLGRLRNIRFPRGVETWKTLQVERIHETNQGFWSRVKNQSEKNILAHLSFFWITNRSIKPRDPVVSANLPSTIPIIFILHASARAMTLTYISTFGSGHQVLEPHINSSRTSWKQHMFVGDGVVQPMAITTGFLRYLLTCYGCFSRFWIVLGASEYIFPLHHPESAVDKYSSIICSPLPPRIDWIGQNWGGNDKNI